MANPKRNSILETLAVGLEGRAPLTSADLEANQPELIESATNKFITTGGVDPDGKGIASRYTADGRLMVDSSVTIEGDVNVQLSNANDDVLIYGFDGAVNRKVKTDASGNLQVDVLSSPLDSYDFATEFTLAAINTQLSDGTQKTQLVDGSGNVISSTSNALNVNVVNAASSEVTQGTTPWVVSGTVTTIPSGTQNVNVVSSVEVEVKNDTGSPIPVDAVNLDIRDLTFADDAVDVSGSAVTVSATDLDVRDLAFATDKVDVSGSSISFIATDLDIRDLSKDQDSVLIYGSDDGGTTKRVVKTDAGGAIQVDLEVASVTVTNASGAAAVNVQDGGNSITIDAVDLDIRDLAFATDSVDVSGSAVTVSSSALPAGASTSALQLLGNASLASIDTKLTDKSQFTKLTDGTDTALVTAAGEQNVLATAQPGVDVGDVTVNNAAGAGAVNIQDGGNSITVDGSITADTELTTKDLDTGAGTDTQAVVGLLGQASGGGQLIGATSNALDINIKSGSIANTAFIANAGTNLNTSLLALEAGNLATIKTNQTDKSQFTKITDGTDTALITAAGEVNVLATAQPGVDIGDVTINNASGAGAVNVQDGGNSITVDTPGLVSTANSTTTPLAGAGVFTGAFEDLKDYSRVTVLVFANQASATDGLAFQWSTDGSNIDLTESSTVNASSGRGFSMGTRGRYFRVVYTNGGAAQATFRLSTVLHAVGDGKVTKPLDRAVTDENFAELVQAPIMARLIGTSTFSNIDCVDNFGSKYLATSFVQKITLAPSNQSTANLASAATFTGGADSTLGADLIQVSFKADQSVTIKVQQSTDGTNWDQEDSYTVAANGGDGRPVQLVANFVRVLVTNNGASSTTFLRLQTLLTPVSSVLPKALTLAGNLRVAEVETIQNFYALRNQKFSLNLELNLPTGNAENNVLLFRNPVGSGKIFYLDVIGMDSLTAGSQISSRVYKGPTVTANGTALTINNDNIAIAGSPSALAFSAPTTSARGTKLRNFSVGTDSNSLVINFFFGITLNPGNDLLLSGSPNANNKIIALDLSWVEVPV